MDYLITGSTGFVGRHLVRRLDTSTNISYELIKHKENVDGAIGRLEVIDCVIHLAGRAHVLNETSRNPYDGFYKANCKYAIDVAICAASKGMKRFIYVSSIGVYGKSSSEVAISEDTSTEPIECYAESKLEAEKQLKKLSEELNFELVIIRPALVYGHDAPGNIERLLKLIAKLPLIPIGVSSNKRSFVYVGNLVEFLLLAAIHPNAAGKAFNISDHAISTRTLIRGFATGMGRDPFVFSPPRFLWKVLLRSLGKRKLYEQLFEDLELDISLAQTELDWEAPFETEDALKLTGKRFKEV